MKKVLFNSSNQAFTGLSKIFIGTSFSSTAGLLFFLYDKFKWTVTDSILTAICFVLSVFFLRFCVFFSRNSWKYYIVTSRESVYGDIIIILKDTFAKVHFIRKQHPVITDDIFISTMAFLCNKLKEIFDKKTKSKCSVCIKVLLKDNNVNNIDLNHAHAQVINLCRNTEALKRDESIIYRQTKHYVFNNTCFLTIFNNLFSQKKEELYFLCNSLPKFESYMNTSFQTYGELPKEIESLKQKKEKWTLPYKSELVIPIIPSLNVKEGEYNLVGFICIDSKDENIFDSKYDVPMLQGVADGIHDIFESWVKSGENVINLYNAITVSKEDSEKQSKARGKKWQIKK